MKNEETIINETDGREATTKAVFALFGLTQEQADKAIKNKTSPLPRNRKHYKLIDDKDIPIYPCKTIDEVLEICKAQGIQTDEKELRKGVKLPDGSFIKDIYESGQLTHESN